METSCKFSKTEEEIATRWKNIWRSSSVYWKVYTRKVFQRPKGITERVEVLKLEHTFLERENENAKVHDRIRKILLDIKKKNGVGKSSDEPVTSESDVHAELLAAGNERKQMKVDKWADIKSNMEEEKTSKKRAADALDSLVGMLAKNEAREAEFNTILIQFMKAKMAKLQ